MPSGTRKCKICGCEYPYCKTVTQDRFRYQDVACSPEHAAEYFRQIELSRQPNQPDTYRNDILIDDIDDEDELFENDFDDTAEEIEIETK